MTPEEIVEALTKSKRLGTHELGGDKNTLVVMQEAGVVKPDGTIKTGKKGRPPIAWVLADKSKVDKVEVVKPKKKRDASDMSAAHQGRRKAREQREKEDIEAQKVELKELKANLPGYQKKYDSALKDTRKAKAENDIKSTFDAADRWQNAVISTSRRIKQLEEACI